MNSENVIPRSYEQWRYCIEVLGKIKLTPTYLNERLAIFTDAENSECKRFAQLYGEDHLQRTVTWFQRAGKEI